MVVVDDFIVDLDKTVIQGRDKDIAALENISGHFPRDGRRGASIVGQGRW